MERGVRMVAMSGLVRRPRAWVAALVLTGVVGLGAPAASAAGTHLSLTYAITIASFNVGQVDAEGRLLDDGGYSIAIRGYTRGVSRLISDATSLMASNGFIRSGQLQPYNFEMESTEGDLIAQASMTIRGRTVTELAVYPGLAAWPDRVPLSGNDVRGVIDPLSAFIVPVRAGTRPDDPDVCDRTLPIFDGWQRFDIDASFRRIETVFTRDGSYAGPVIVCGLRYDAIAGHQENQESVAYMEGNDGLEVWLMPVEGRNVFLPYQIIIATEAGDMGIRLQSLMSEPDTLGAIE